MGACWRDGTHLHYRDARQRFLAELPASYKEVCKLRKGALCSPLLGVLTTVWSDQVLRVAKAKVGLISPEEASDWDEKVWWCVPHEIQDDFRSFVGGMETDAVMVERRLAPEVRSFASFFYDPE